MPKKPDKGGTAVRKVPKRKVDPRVDQSTQALGGALIALMQERAFDTITVQDVLDRAGVARSTFYAHFSNKEDLFLSDYERLLAHVDAAADQMGPNRLIPVAELLAHFVEAGSLLDAVIESGQMSVVREMMATQFARTIERRSNADRATAVFCAGALVELIRWWLAEPDRPTPAEMDRRFHELAFRALATSPSP